jgi:hypothetical protein
MTSSSHPALHSFAFVTKGRTPSLDFHEGKTGGVLLKPPHIGKIFLGQKMKFLKGAGSLRPILGTKTFFLVSDPSTPLGWGFFPLQQ